MAVELGRRMLVGLLVSITTAACGGAGTSVPGAAPSGHAATPVALPVDSSLTPVSRSSPSSQAARAFDLCGVADLRDSAASAPSSAIADFSQVAGMALVPSARDVGKYMPTYGSEAELKTDQPAWVIQFTGSIPTRQGPRSNLTCVVIGDFPIVYSAFGDGTSTPAPGVRQPTFALPSLQP